MSSVALGSGSSLQTHLETTVRTSTTVDPQKTSSATPSGKDSSFYGEASTSAATKRRSAVISVGVVVGVILLAAGLVDLVRMVARANKKRHPESPPRNIVRPLDAAFVAQETPQP
jgi:hypothetical protein